MAKNLFALTALPGCGTPGMFEEGRAEALFVSSLQSSRSDVRSRPFAD
jgi:hypothetical protein